MRTKYFNPYHTQFIQPYDHELEKLDLENYDHQLLYSEVLSELQKIIARIMEHHLHQPLKQTDIIDIELMQRYPLSQKQF